MVRQLQGELLADVPGADDDGVLLVPRQVAAERPRDGAQRRDQDDGGEPEDAKPGEHRLHEVGRNTEESEDPDSDRDAAEDTDDVVDRRMVGALLVPVVEPLEPQQEEPARDREQERYVLETRRDTSPVASLDRRAHWRGTNARTSPDDVRDEQDAPNESATTIAPPEQTARRMLLVERSESQHPARPHGHASPQW